VSRRVVTALLDGDAGSCITGTTIIVDGDFMTR